MNYTFGGLAKELNKSRTVVVAAFRQVRKLPEYSHLLAESVDMKAKAPILPESHVEPIRKFLDKYSPVNSLCNEFKIASSGRKKLLARAKEGDLREHAIRDSGGIVFLKREVMDRIKINLPKKRTPLSGIKLKKREPPPDYRQKIGRPVHEASLIREVEQKLYGGDYQESRKLIPTLIREAGGHYTKFAHALQTAVQQCPPVELHNLVNRVEIIEPRLRRALLENYLEKRNNFIPRTGVEHDDALKQATTETLDKY